MKEKDTLYDALKSKFENISNENEFLLKENENFKSEIKKREKLEKEWDLLLKNIKSKIKHIQKENDGF